MKITFSPGFRSQGKSRKNLRPVFGSVAIPSAPTSLGSGFDCGKLILGGFVQVAPATSLGADAAMAGAAMTAAAPMAVSKATTLAMRMVFPSSNAVLSMVAEGCPNAPEVALTPVRRRLFCARLRDWRFRWATTGERGPLLSRSPGPILEKPGDRLARSA